MPGSYVGNACERLPASVDPPAGVSTSPNHTTKWTVYKSGTSEVLSAVEAGSVVRLFIECMAVEAMPMLTPACGRLNRPQICKFSYFFQRVVANWWARCRFTRTQILYTVKGKSKGLDTCYSAAYTSQTRDQQSFTISEAAAD